MAVTLARGNEKKPTGVHRVAQRERGERTYEKIYTSVLTIRGHVLV